AASSRASSSGWSTFRARSRGRSVCCAGSTARKRSPTGIRSRPVSTGASRCPRRRGGHTCSSAAMNWLLLWIHLFALPAWLGETLFFSAVVAPALFGGLDVEQAGAAVALIFPGYYVLGYASGALLVGTALALWRRSRPAGGLWLLSGVLAALALG